MRIDSLPGLQLAQAWSVVTVDAHANYVAA